MRKKSGYITFHLYQLILKYKSCQVENKWDRRKVQFFTARITFAFIREGSRDKDAVDLVK